MHIQVVLDGHGEYGEFIASICKTFLITQIINYANDNEKKHHLLSITELESFLKLFVDTECNEMIKKY